MIAESLLVLAIAATPGIPEVPTIVRSDVWIGLQNDILTLYPTDTGRTYGFSGGVLYNNFIIKVDASALTEHQVSCTKRIDVLTGLIGYQFEVNDMITLTPAIGYEARNDFGGQEWQNKFHQAINAHSRYWSAYEEAEDTIFGSIYFRAHKRDGGKYLDYVDFSSGLQVGSGADVDFMSQFVVGVDTGKVPKYIGIRLEFHDGEDTTTERDVESLESGFRMVCGISFRSLSYSLSFDFSKRYGSGEIFYSF